MDLWDGIIGIRGYVGLGQSKWAIPYYLDVGTGTSAITSQAMAGPFKLTFCSSLSPFMS